MNKPDLSVILKVLMFQKGVKPTQLAKDTNLPQQTVQRLVAGTSPRPHISTLLPLAEYFQISLQQLRGERPIPDLQRFFDYSAEKSGITELPLLSWDEVVAWPNNRADLQNSQKVFTDASVSKNAFALCMIDSSMEPLYPKGTILIIDPEKEIKDRRYAVVKLVDQDNAILRWLLINGNEYYLKPLSPDFQQFSMMKLQQDDRICGVLVQAKQTLVD